jgi:WD40 repeat protein
VPGNGNYCLSCGQDKSIKLWNPHKGVLIKTYTGHGYEVLDVAVYVVLTPFLLLRRRRLV